jgi:hypothetical protein
MLAARAHELRSNQPQWHRVR